MTHILQRETQQGAQLLERASRFVNPTSELKPLPTMQWMRKHIHGHEYTVKSDTRFLTALLVRLIATCTKGYTQQRRRRPLARFLWACGPENISMPFLAGAYAWLQSGHTAARHTLVPLVACTLHAVELNKMVHSCGSIQKPFRCGTPRAGVGIPDHAGTIVGRHTRSC